MQVFQQKKCIRKHECSRNAFFAPFGQFLCLVQIVPYREQGPSERGTSAVVTGTPSLYDNRLRQPKQPFAYTQTTVPVYAKAIVGSVKGALLGRGWGTLFGKHSPRKLPLYKGTSRELGHIGLCFFKFQYIYPQHIYNNPKQLNQVY